MKLMDQTFYLITLFLPILCVLFPICMPKKYYQFQRKFFTMLIPKSSEDTNKMFSIGILLSFTMWSSLYVVLRMIEIIVSG